jgi:PAS domain-containing protein
MKERDRNISPPIELLQWMVASLEGSAVILYIDGAEFSRSASAIALFGQFNEQLILSAIDECLSCETGEVAHTFPHVRSSQRRRFLGTDMVELVFKLSIFPGDPRYRMISIERGVSYDTLIEQYEYIRYLCETVDKGLGIFELDPSTGKSWLLWGSQKYAQLSGASIEELKEHGIPSVGRLVPNEDRERCEFFMRDGVSSMTGYSIVPRIFRDGEYRFTRYTVKCTPGDNGLIECSVISEDYNDEAIAREASIVEQSATQMLSSFMTAVFDVSFYIDSLMYIIDDSPKLRHFLGISESVAGQSIESFMLELDKKVFRDFISRFSGSVSSRSPCGFVAPMIRVRLFVGEVGLTDVEILHQKPISHPISGSIEALSQE